MTPSRAVALPTKLHANAPLDAEGIKRRTRRQYVFWLFMGMAVSLLVQSYLRNKNSDITQPMRKLLDSSDCTSHPEWIEKGGVVVYFIGTCYLFIGIYIVCEDYFIKSLEEISTRLKLSKDVAGATFMAAGSSAPELFTSLVALTNDNASNDIGVGTIVGSAVFNILVIIGVSAVFSGGTLELDYRPLVRDCLFYAAAIIGVIGVFYNGKIYWWEGLIFVMLYGLYILAMKFNQAILNLLESLRSTEENVVGNNINVDSATYALLGPSTSSREINSGLMENVNGAPLVPAIDDGTSSRKTTIPQHDDQNRTKNSNNIGDSAESGADNKNLFSSPEGKVEKLYWMVFLPWRVVFYYTIRDCSKDKFKNWYMVTFVASILWIGVISWFMVEWATDIGCVLGIPSTIMGVTILAAGTSIPDALSSIEVAQKGEGDMAVANAVGSNVFDIWLGLGLPWLFVIPFNGESSSFGNYIEVDNDDLILSVGILFGVLIFYIVCVVISGWKIDKRHGFMFIFLYLVYALYYIIVEWALDV